MLTLTLQLHMLSDYEVTVKSFELVTQSEYNFLVECYLQSEM